VIVSNEQDFFEDFERTQPKYRRQRFIVGDARGPLFKLTFVNNTLTELESLQ